MSSTWTWHSEYQLYWNPELQKWAKPKADGTGFEYSDPAATNARPMTVYADIAEESTARAKAHNHDSGIEWPDEQADDRFEAGATAAKWRNVPLLRLVLESRPTASQITAQQQIAMFDPAQPIVIGRDKTFEPRLRLKDLAVSKTHATIYWDETSERWSVVDCGSTHGTWIRSTLQTNATKQRLSDPKVASTPRSLEHGDQLYFGSTKFRVHLHASFACDECSLSSDQSNLIAFVSLNDVASVDKAATAREETPRFELATKADKEQNRRERMVALKQQYLAPSASAGQPRPFVDRAKQRRSRDGATASVTAAFKPTGGSDQAVQASSATSTPAQTLADPESNVDPFSSGSKGAQLLSKMSGPAARSDETAGQAVSHLGKLVEARTVGVSTGRLESRPGLGSRPLIDAHAAAPQSAVGDKRSWQDDVREANRKRFRDLQ
ncbi:hypothetical protein OIO90_006033 [Microbotryomycetes sp. JL221]|nr:hypothetical protein OIO90_006033 [Microbotryomycetes sp. JL221]